MTIVQLRVVTAGTDECPRCSCPLGDSPAPITLGDAEHVICGPCALEITAWWYSGQAAAVKGHGNAVTACDPLTLAWS